jgi:anti-sigma-K factor RskA
MPERSYSTRKKSDEASMTTKNKQPARHDIEELLPWYATGTLTNRDAERVEQALAGDRKLAQRHELVRRELAETTRLNEALDVPSARHGQLICCNQRGGGACATPSAQADQWDAFSRARQRS